MILMILNLIFKIHPENFSIKLPGGLFLIFSSFCYVNVYLSPKQYWQVWLCSIYKLCQPNFELIFHNFTGKISIKSLNSISASRSRRSSLAFTREILNSIRLALPSEKNSARPSFRPSMMYIP